ncbi:MAG: bifunctional methylenetetrahydrofolate dehydrogenase/methenyltetrahydrofolate cyclohydrolase FolD [Candidatus Dadabacteria bacterium]|nr:bifunctional methylenetetrahydrofolate dehydrogenase/methenyltetrahydrofolate cyclohydrolase FolD [Candidatus Dadabacteria bacterium]NIS08733.1 bifunctional methylenetetrahydrofolate dehydrogenase/methenyltetrahydrofolate cyclohydrolase FolD [Candidatus Dadabacteria bacterium]NIV42617.1 bifunctional methylenetetrahydrofolate dehydrogenase/methenyltetrahydrofolate cyclohydrolase FolD [Candidatus Dadabacteria bacterium]NIX15419.1 bifunctional methylenetetrahydrofolate dehydrogenase/methenyltetr
MAELIDGKVVSQSVRDEVQELTGKLKEDTGVVPGLAAVLVGDDPASEIYVRNKRKACEKVGIYSEEHKLPAETTEEQLLELVNKLNDDPKIHGILVQLPLPDHINETTILRSVSPLKDVDGFHPYNVGLLVEGNPSFVSCTPAGIIRMLEYYNLEIKGKEVVVVGRSNIVGKPVSMLLLHRHGTVTICHSRTKDLSEVTNRADILVAAIGRANFITGDMVKKGAVVIDVGINRKDDGKLTGDVDFEAVSEKASYITPVPGGVGPMTIAMLLYNTFLSAKSTAES